MLSIENQETINKALAQLKINRTKLDDRQRFIAIFLEVIVILFIILGDSWHLALGLILTFTAVFLKMASKSKLKSLVPTLLLIGLFVRSIPFDFNLEELGLYFIFYGFIASFIWVGIYSFLYSELEEPLKKEIDKATSLRDLKYKEEFSEFFSWVKDYKIPEAVSLYKQSIKQKEDITYGQYLDIEASIKKHKLSHYCSSLKINADKEDFRAIERLYEWVFIECAKDAIEWFHKNNRLPTPKELEVLDYKVEQSHYRSTLEVYNQDMNANMESGR